VASRSITRFFVSNWMCGSGWPGFFGSGTPWLWQQKGVEPDVVAFGKKTQVCGIYANRRVEEVDDHVFAKASRINSTWGGNLVDMVRCRRFIEIIEAGSLGDAIARRGGRCVDGLREIARETGRFANVRGVGSLIAFTLPDGAARDAFVKGLCDRKVLALPCGEDSVRFRLPLVIEDADVDELLSRTREVAKA